MADDGEDALMIEQPSLGVLVVVAPGSRRSHFQAFHERGWRGGRPVYEWRAATTVCGRSGELSRASWRSSSLRQACRACWGGLQAVIDAHLRVCTLGGADTP